MNLLRALGLRRDPQRSDAAILRDKLPEVNAFVDVAIGGRSQRESVPVNELTNASLVTRCPKGLEVGAAADFLYSNALGKFRFSTCCTTVDGKDAHFELPQTIKTLERFGERRTGPRVSWVIPVQWRDAPAGVGFGEYVQGSMMDLSRGGASLVVGRELKLGAQVEVRFMLKTKKTLFVELCEVVRSVKIETSGMNATGIRFLQIEPANERTLMDFLTERQLTRRDRGVV